MAKRKTLKQRQEEMKGALHQRISDIYSGACGRDMDNEDGILSMEEASRVLPAIMEVFRDQLEGKTFLKGLHMLDKYETIDQATECLFGYGIRA